MKNVVAGLDAKTFRQGGRRCDSGNVFWNILELRICADDFVCFFLQAKSAELCNEIVEVEKQQAALIGRFRCAFG